MACEKCGHELQISDFPFCKGDAEDHRLGRFGVVGDDLPGGVEIRHGLCNADGSPRKFYSKSEMAKEAKARGLENHVVHRGLPGTDKSPHTTRWV